jgi:hypothetical protein
MRRTCICCFLLLFAPALSVLADEDTWIANRRKAQLAMDPTLIPKGKGMLFVPTMTSGFREPNYQIFRNGKEIATEETGTGVLLSPGAYEVLIGSGIITQMMRREVEIVEGWTSLVEPWWSGLAIDVIDETRASTKESYELFDEGRQQENFGIGFGVEEERGEAVDTWLLKPGTYTIVKVGENVATPRKFSVRLLPGELIQRNLVVDDNGNFVGFYPPSYLQLGGQLSSKWNSRWELSMSTQFNTSQNTANEEASLSFTGQLRNRSRYNSERHFFDLRIILEEGFTKEGGEVLRKSVDEIEARSTYIFRLSRRLGPYLRGVLNSKLFPADQRFDAPQVLTLIDAEGQIIETLQGITEFTREPSFYPLELRQGIGINFEAYRSFPLNIDLRIGLGASQKIVSDSFELIGDTAIEQENVSSTGLNALIILDAQLGRYINLDSELDILMPSSRTSAWEFTFENRVRTFLTPFINMDIVFDLERQKPLNELQSSQQVLLRFVKLF